LIQIIAPGRESFLSPIDRGQLNGDPAPLRRAMSVNTAVGR